LNIPIWNQLGGFDDLLFIDLVDYEYCYRARVNGFKLIQFSNVFITHNVGIEVYRSSIKSLFLVRKKKSIHSPLRCYYMYRNMLYLESKYRDTNVEFTTLIRRNVEKHVKTCLYYGREMSKVRRYVRIAKQDFQSGIMGKIQDSKIVD
jgi:rhamnosyltransferase